jgi:Tfp pilus assembly protein PilO
MSSERKALFNLSLILAVIVAAGAFIAWPNYRRAASIGRQLESLQVELGSLEIKSSLVEALAEDLGAKRDRIRRDLKTIPLNPETPDLIGRLSGAIGASAVNDHTFNNGTIAVLQSVEDGSLSVQPVTIDITSDFEPVFSLIREVEEMDRLVRITSVHMARLEGKESWISSSVGVEAVFETPGWTEAKP